MSRALHLLPVFTFLLPPQTYLTNKRTERPHVVCLWSILARLDFSPCGKKLNWKRSQFTNPSPDSGRSKQTVAVTKSLQSKEVVIIKVRATVYCFLMQRYAHILLPWMKTSAFKYSSRRVPVIPCALWGSSSSWQLRLGTGGSPVQAQHRPQYELVAGEVPVRLLGAAGVPLSEAQTPLSARGAPLGSLHHLMPAGPLCARVCFWPMWVKKIKKISPRGI